jgi:hypothetical protein
MNNCITISTSLHKISGDGVDHPHQFSAEVNGREELYFYSPYGPSWQVIG